MSWIGPVYHTQGETWGGTQIDYTMFKAISVLGGFFGLDHIFLRSPRTGILKFIVNIFTFGFWYMYDIIQLFTDSEFIKKYGLTIPLLGPSGIGAGIFHGAGTESRAPLTAPTPLLFVVFALLTWIPFGVSQFVAGDFKGGAAQFVLTFSPLFFMAFLWALYSAFNTIVNTASVLKDGTDRFFPVTLLMSAKGPAPNIMIPKAPSLTEGGGFVGALAEALTGFSFLLGPYEKPVLQGIAGAAETGIHAAKTLNQGLHPIEVPSAPSVQLPQTGGALENTSSILFLGLAAFVLFGSLVITAVRYSSAPKVTKNSNTNTDDDIPPEANTDEPPSGSRVF